MSVLRIRDENGNAQEILAIKGEKGDKGDAGSVKFIVCPTLPTENIDEEVIYLTPTTKTGEQNIYEEYVYIDGIWEKIGGTTVEVNFDDYVKNTDYATKTNAGVVLIDDRYGVRILNGVLDVCAANNSHIDQRTMKESPLYERIPNTRYPIVPANLDYAVKVGVTANVITLTDDEKTAAQAWLGVGNNTETWTFTLENGSTVTKTVVLK